MIVLWDDACSISVRNYSIEEGGPRREVRTDLWKGIASSKKTTGVSCVETAIAITGSSGSAKGIRKSSMQLQEKLISLLSAGLPEASLAAWVVCRTL